MRKRALLPIGDTLIANDGQEASMRFICARCKTPFKNYVCIEEDGSSIEARCTVCGLYVQLHASLDIQADGGKPGSGK